jgi:hypothetical protein
VACYIANVLQLNTGHLCLYGRRALAALLVAIVLLLDAMAVCPVLHEMIHKDADEPDHHCAVTTLQHGKIESATCEIIIPEPTLLVEAPQHFRYSLFSPAIENLPHGRAPPARSAVS